MQKILQCIVNRLIWEMLVANWFIGRPIGEYNRFRRAALADMKARKVSWL